MIDEHLVFRANRLGRVEDFEDGSLLFLCDRRRLIDINAMGKRILDRLDGKRTVADIARERAASSGESYGTVLGDVVVFLDELEKTGAVHRQVTLSFEKGDSMENAVYMSDPDISFREEEDGGILYNADTDGLEILNPSGVAIWTYLSQPHTQADVVDHLVSLFEDAPRDQIEKDVGVFLDDLVKKGYIGTVEEETAP